MGYLCPGGKVWARMSLQTDQNNCLNSHRYWWYVRRVDILPQDRNFNEAFKIFDFTQKTMINTGENGYLLIYPLHPLKPNT